MGELPDNPADVEKTLEQFQTKLRDRPAIDPAVAQELETYRILSRNSAISKSLTYDRDFVKPVQNAFEDLVYDIASSVSTNDPNSMKQWAQEVLAHPAEDISGPWIDEHMALVKDGLARERIRSKAGNLSSKLDLPAACLESGHWVLSAKSLLDRKIEVRFEMAEHFV
jgi:hypothetical protein